MKRLSKLLVLVSFLMLFCAIPVSAATTSLKHNTWSKAAKTGEMDRLFKFKLSKAGNVTIYSNDVDVTFDLLDKSKNVQYQTAYLDDEDSHRASFYLKAGTYYIRPYTTTQYSNSYKVKYKFDGDYTLKNKGKVKLYPGSGYADLYIKYKATKTGYVTLTRIGQSANYITFCNSKKKALSSTSIVGTYNNVDYGDKVAYGVKKNTTYYIKVSGNNLPLTLKMAETAVSEKSGSSKKKAVELKSGKVAKGVIVAGDGTADWYKFQLKKAKKVTITLKANTNDTIKMEFFEGSRSMGSRYLAGYGDSGTVVSTNSLGGNKWSKGWYYIKVTRDSSKASGFYSIKWK